MHAHTNFSYDAAELHDADRAGRVAFVAVATVTRASVRIFVLESFQYDWTVSTRPMTTNSESVSELLGGSVEHLRCDDELRRHYQRKHRDTED